MAESATFLPVSNRDVGRNPRMSLGTMRLQFAVKSALYILMTGNRLKVIGACTSTIAAKMVEFFVFRDGSNKHFIQKPVNIELSSTQPYLGITVSSEWRQPLPAAVCSTRINLRPEAFTGGIWTASKRIAGKLIGHRESPFSVSWGRLLPTALPLNYTGTVA